MAYGAEHESIRALLEDGFESLRPVLRINAEIITPDADDEGGGLIRIEFNTPVCARGKRGWLNLITLCESFADIAVERGGKTTGFAVKAGGQRLLDIAFTRVGAEGGCPKESDNDGTFCFDTASGGFIFRNAERIEEHKEYCDCEFCWNADFSAALPYNADAVRRAIRIQSGGVLGAYAVSFSRGDEHDAERAK